ncbi:MAG: prolipoprotein diacylglyceryl transferase [Candidatus Dadabacteria bacterium]|nr:prolipoprotein diacylglyceryl transferase [Candidatus Dadabacteria bacterium]
MYPVLFRIGDFPVSSYTVMLIIGFLVAYLLCIGEFKRKGLSEDLLDLLFTACVIGALLGSKVLFIVENATFKEFIADPVRYLSSGLTQLGGFIGAFILFWVIVRIKNLNFWLAADAMAPLVITYVIGRIGCLLVGDDYGIPSNLPWAMSFPQGEPPTWERVHPTQIYEMLAMAIIFIYVWKVRKKDKPVGWLAAFVLLLMGSQRFLIEFLRNTTPSFIPGISLAQLMSLGLVAGGVLKLLQIRMHETNLAKSRLKE